MRKLEFSGKLQIHGVQGFGWTDYLKLKMRMDYDFLCDCLSYEPLWGHFEQN